MLEDMYVRSKLNEFEQAHLARRARIMAEIESFTPPPGRVKSMVAPRLVKAGAWLERLGMTMAGAQE